MMGCGAVLSLGNGTLAWLYANGNPSIYYSTYLLNSIAILYLSLKCLEMAVGSNAYLHLPSTQINTLYSLFNATKWANAWGMGWAMLLLDNLGSLDALYMLCGHFSTTRLCCIHGNRGGGGTDPNIL